MQFLIKILKRGNKRRISKEDLAKQKGNDNILMHKIKNILVYSATSQQEIMQGHLMRRLTRRVTISEISLMIEMFLWIHVIWISLMGLSYGTP